MRPKILFLTTKCPYPPQEGMTLRTYNLIKYVSSFADIHLLSLLQDGSEASGLEHLKAYCQRVKGVPVKVNQSNVHLLWAVVRSLCSKIPFVCRKYDVPEMRLEIREAVRRERYDAVHYDLLPLAIYRNETAGLRNILVEHNVESNLLMRRARQERNSLLKLFLFLQWHTLRKYEQTICPEFEHCVVMSEIDKNDLKAMAPAARLTVVPNGVDTKYFTPYQGALEENALVFVGSQAWHPNLNAIRYFISDILPVLVRRRPDIKVYFIGKIMRDDLVPDKYKNNVIMTGLVDDIRTLTTKASVYIVPLQVGGGTRLKILDAMAMGKAIVSTSIGCEGIGVTDGKNIIIADEPGEFASQIDKLLGDREMIERLGKAARMLAETKYDWNTIYQSMHAIYMPGQNDPVQGKGAKQ